MQDIQSCRSSQGDGEGWLYRLHMQTNKHMEARCQTLVITRRERSIRFMSRSDMVFLTNCTAPGMFRSMRILWRHSVTKFFTSRQLSLLTVSIPAFHKLRIHCSEKCSLAHAWLNMHLIFACYQSGIQEAMLPLPSSQHLVTSFHCDLSHPQWLHIFNANFLTSFSGSGSVLWN
jgi:hypothetical protein